jgi:hypothetical protein
MKVVVQNEDDSTTGYFGIQSVEQSHENQIELTTFGDVKVANTNQQTEGVVCSVASKQHMSGKDATEELTTLFGEQFTPNLGEAIRQLRSKENIDRRGVARRGS